MANIANVKVKQGNVLSLSGSTVEITGSTTVGGNLNVQGTISASVLTISETIISSSIVYHSGSTRFGDEAIDSHTFTGSVNISGTTHSITGPLNIIGNVSGTTFTGSFSGDGSQLTNLTLVGSAVTAITGSTNINVSSITGDVTASLSDNLAVVSVTASSGLNTVNLLATGSFTIAQRTVTASVSVTSTDQVIFADATSGILTVTVPAVAIGNAGRQLVVKKIDAGTNTVTVSGSIDNGSFFELNGPYQSITLVSDGSTNWFVL